MAIEEVRFYSGGARLAGTLKLPESGAAPFPAVVQGPGWLGLRGAKLYHPYHEALLAAGIAVLVFDYRGFGDSEGDASYLDPMTQVADWSAAVTYLETRPEIDPRAHRRVRLGRHGRRQRDLRGRPGSAHQGRRLPGARRGWPRLDAPDAPRARVAGVPRVHQGGPRAARPHRRVGHGAAARGDHGAHAGAQDHDRQDGRRRPRAQAGPAGVARRRSSPTSPSTSWTASRPGR